MHSVFLRRKQAGEPQRELEEARTQRTLHDRGLAGAEGGSVHWASGVLTAIRDDTGKLTGYIRVSRDMTLQKRLEESLAQVAADLEKRVAERTIELEETVAELQRKNQEVEAFVHIVSHDLRAPLVNVQGFVRELEESCKSLKKVIQSCPRWEVCWSGVRPVLEDEIGGALHYISASTTKFERLINALLGLSRQGRQVYQMARVNVWELVITPWPPSSRRLPRLAPRSRSAVLPSATADVTALGQVFSNLIGKRSSTAVLSVRSELKLADKWKRGSCTIGCETTAWAFPNSERKSSFRSFSASIPASGRRRNGIGHCASHCRAAWG